LSRHVHCGGTVDLHRDAPRLATRQRVAGAAAVRLGRIALLLSNANLILVGDVE